MNLFIMRHGEALPTGGDITEDAVRPLSETGKTQVRRASLALKERSLVLQKVVSSPLVRANQTAQIVTEVLGLPAPSVSPALAPSASPSAIRALLDASNTPGLLCVGHHPDVTLWTAFLTGLDPSVCPLFNTASLVALQFKPSAKKADFLWFQA